MVWSIHRGRKGHVGYNAQLELLEYLVELIGDEAEVWLLGDAGFESVHLFNWLTQHNWHFVLRHPGKKQSPLARATVGQAQCDSCPTRRNPQHRLGRTYCKALPPDPTG
ncbi:MAG: hypothetical protein R2867_19260 [Caldilineaceae bacterium]